MHPHLRLIIEALDCMRNTTVTFDLDILKLLRVRFSLALDDIDQKIKELEESENK